MAVKPGPIVITLKKRLGSGRPDDAPASEPPAAAAPPPPGDRSRSRSRPIATKSPATARERSASPARPAAATAPALKGSKMLNVTSLEDIFTRFRSELDRWLEDESTKLEKVEARGATSRKALSGGAQIVCDFLREHDSDRFSGLGSDPQGEGFCSRTLPHFLEVIDEDHKALQEISTLIGSYAGRRFPKNEDLVVDKADSPIPVLKTLLQELETSTSKPAGPPDQQDQRRRRRRRRRADD